MPTKKILAAALLSMAAVAFANIEPMVLGAIADDLSLGADKLGMLAGIELLGIGLGAIAAPLWINKVDWRLAAIAALTICIIGSILSMFIHRYDILLPLRGLVGFFGEGSGYALAVVALGEAEDTDSAFGYSMVFTAVFTAAGFFVLPAMIGHWGVIAPWSLIIFTMLLVLPFLRWLPESSQKRRSQTIVGDSFPTYVVFLGLATLIIWYVGVGAFWAFIERYATSKGVAPQAIGNAGAIGSFTAILGGAAAAWMGNRYGRVWPCCVVFITHACIGLVLINWFDAKSLTLAMSIFMIMWGLGYSYLFGLIATADSHGRFLALAPGFQLIAMGVGPAIAGQVAASYGLVVINIFFAICCLVSLVTFLPFAFLVTRNGLTSKQAVQLDGS